MKTDKNLYVAANATIIGDVELGNNVNVWYGAVIRGDVGPIRIGECTNVQDNCVIHEVVTVGKGCSIGHSAILHGCTVGNDCIIGMGAIILNGAVIGDNCIVGAGSVVSGKMNAPAGSLILGNPAKVIKPLSQEQIDSIYENCRIYTERAQIKFG